MILSAPASTPPPYIQRLGDLGAPTIPSPSPALTAITTAIQTQEGYYPGSLAYKNNNPGNLIYTPYYAQNFGALPGAGGFSLFPDYNTGLAALQHQIQVNANSGMTIDSMMSAYAPAQNADGSPSGNNPQLYAQNIASALGVDPSTPLTSILSDPSLSPGSPSSLSPSQVSNSDAEFPGIEAGDVSWGTVALVAGGALGLMLLMRRI